MAIVAFSVLTMLVMKSVAGKIYEDCKVAIWLTVILIAGLCAVLLSKILLIPIVLLF